MKRKRFVHIGAVLCVVSLVLAACKRQADFTVEGVVSGADGQVMYLENVGVSSVETLDSVRLTAAGEFRFERPRPAYPDFYRLRLNNQLINFSIDSTETISFVADAETFATSYRVEGSENCKAIKNITLAQLDANQAIGRARRAYEADQLADTAYARQVEEAVGAYKEVARRYIYSAPMSAAAYFALFQQIDGLLLFDLYDKEDSKAYGAVATSLDHFYPESPRAKHLYNLALQSIKVIRSQRPVNLDNVKREEVGYVDIELPDIQGVNQNLSALAPGNIVLLNFTAYMSEWSPALNMALGELYVEYHDKGLEVYQVSLDGDVHFWKNAASNLPWTCVRDPQTVYSQVAALYNVKQLPVIFVLDRSGNLVKRVDDMKNLAAEVGALF